MQILQTGSGQHQYVLPVHASDFIFCSTSKQNMQTVNTITEYQVISECEKKLPQDLFGMLVIHLLGVCLWLPRPQRTRHSDALFSVHFAGLFFCVQARAVSAICRLLHVCPAEDIAQSVSPTYQSTRGLHLPTQLDHGQGHAQPRACDDLP